MKPLAQTQTIEKASDKDIQKYIVPAFTKTFNIEKQALTFSHEKDQINKQRLFFNVHEKQLSKLRADILDSFLKQIALALDLSNHESIKYGNAYHANGIGNNVQLPIIVNTVNKEIHFGYLNANHDIFCNIKHFYLTDNHNERLDTPSYDLVSNL